MPSCAVHAYLTHGTHAQGLRYLSCVYMCVCVCVYVCVCVCVCLERMEFVYVLQHHCGNTLECSQIPQPAQQADLVFLLAQLVVQPWHLTSLLHPPCLSDTVTTLPPM